MLWNKEELKELFDLDQGANGVSIDTRSLQKDDLFFGVLGKNGVDGMRFANKAINAGAAGVIEGLDNLEKLGRASCDRCSATRIAVTGSVGKTSSKEMLRIVFGEFGNTHASIGSYNNQWGVPLSLARMPRDTQFGVFEMGMSAAGELRKLVKQVVPHIALITWIAPAHMEFFKSLEAIADAKSEVFETMDGSGVAVLPSDSPNFERLCDNAVKNNVGRIITFGRADNADFKLISTQNSDSGMHINAVCDGKDIVFDLNIHGEHHAVNALGVLACVSASEEDVSIAAKALSNFKAPPRRGEVALTQAGLTILDESYNANPVSMGAALETLSDMNSKGRHVAVLADMGELGANARAFHTDLQEIIRTLNIDVVVTCGPMMNHLHKVLPPRLQGAHFNDIDALIAHSDDLFKAGDLILIKGSNYMGMNRLVAHLQTA